MSGVALDRGEFVRPKEPLRLISTNIMTGESTPGAPPFEIIGLRVLPDSEFDFLRRPKKPTTPQEPITENPITKPKEE
jgi:hypothetical protein